MDTVGDLLARIKNAYMAKLEKVVLPYSKQNLALTEVLAEEGYIQSYDETLVDGKTFKRIEAVLKYEGRKAVLSNLKRISKPGLRVYSDRKHLPRVLNGLGIAIISTPKGIMTDKKARKLGFGGEVMAYVW